MNIQSQLDALESSGLIRMLNVMPELEYLFRHSLVQEAAYQSLLKQNRRELHQAIGETLEREANVVPSQLAAVLANHFYESDDSVRALKYYTLAGDHAARKFASAESLAHYTRALDAARTVDADAATFTHLYLARGRALEMSGQYDEALCNDLELEQEATARGDRAMELAAVLARMTIYCAPTDRFNPGEAQSLSERAMAIAGELGDRKAEAKILWNLVLLNRFTNRYDQAVVHGERSAALARELGLREQLAYTLNDMYPGYMSIGQVNLGRAALQEAHGLWRELGNLPMLADSLTNMAEINWTTGHLREGIAQAMESLQISRSIGNAWGQSYSGGLLGMIYTELAEFDRAFEYFALSQRLGHEAGFVVMDIMCPTGIALCLASLGAPSRAIPFAQSAIDAAERSLPSFRAFPLAIRGWLSAIVGDAPAAESAIQAARLEMKASDPILNAFVGSAAGDAALRMGQPTQALADADGALALIHDFGLTGSAPDALHLRARALAALDRPDEAYTTLKRSFDIAVQTGWRRDFWSIADDLAQVAASRGYSDEAKACTTTARKEVEFVAAHAPDAGLRDSFLALQAVQRILPNSLESEAGKLPRLEINA